MNNPITKALEAGLAKDWPKESCEFNLPVDISHFRKTPAYHLHLPILQAGALLEDALAVLASLNTPLPNAAQEKLLEAYEHLREADRLTRRMMVSKEKRGPKQDEARLEAMHRYIRENRHMHEGWPKSLNRMAKELDIPRATFTRFLAEHYEELYETCYAGRQASL